MHKHRGFPSRAPGTDYQFTIRHSNKKAPRPLKERPRYADRRARDLDADRKFLAALIKHFGAEPFARGNLDAGRLSWFLGREIVPVEPDFDPQSYDAVLKIDLLRAQISFPELFAHDQNQAKAYLGPPPKYRGE